MKKKFIKFLKEQKSYRNFRKLLYNPSGSWFFENCRGKILTELNYSRVLTYDQCLKYLRRTNLCNNSGFYLDILWQEKNHKFTYNNPLDKIIKNFDYKRGSQGTYNNYQTRYTDYQSIYDSYLFSTQPFFVDYIYTST